MKTFSRIICFLFICTFTLLSFGCGTREDDAGNANTDLYGVKVLYRPTKYDYDGGDNGDEDYYGAYAWNILYDLMRTYGLASSVAYIDEFEKVEDWTTRGYYYDSIRHNFVSQDNYTAGKTVFVEDANGDISFNGKKYTQTDTLANNRAVITMDTSLAWDWTWGSKYTKTEALIFEPYIGSGPLAGDKSIISNTYAIAGNTNLYFSNIEEYYTNTNDSLYNFNATEYRKIFVGPTEQSHPDEYSDFVKALEYVIYCQSMDITPATIKAKADSIESAPKVEIFGYDATDDKTSAEVALDFIKGVFDDIGTYIGIDDRRADALTDYILDYVIGQDTITADDTTITTYSAHVNEYRDANGNIAIDTATPQVVHVKRDYETVVRNIVKRACADVQIGRIEDDDVHIDERYARSYIKDYYGSQFETSSDSGHEFDGIEAMEYQSAVIMPRKAITIENIYIDFKYDGEMDGNNRDSSITINVALNYFTKNAAQPQRIAAQTITVPAGDYEALSDTHTLYFDGLGGNDGLTVSAFTYDINKGIMIPEGMKYDGSVMVSENPLKILGTSLLKNYYLITDDDEIMLNHKMFAGVCDYFEIVYQVVKVNVGNSQDYTPKNYKFYTAIGLLDYKAA